MFLYASSVWMFHCTKLNNCINLIHEWVSRTSYSNYERSLDQLLLKDNSFKNHHHNQQKLAIETFKVKIVIAPAITTWHCYSDK